MFTAGRGLRRSHAVLSCSCNQPLDPGLDSFGAVNVVRAVLSDHYASPFVAWRNDLSYHITFLLPITIFAVGLEASYHHRTYLSPEV